MLLKYLTVLHVLMYCFFLFKCHLPQTRTPIKDSRGSITNHSGSAYTKFENFQICNNGRQPCWSFSTERLGTQQVYRLQSMNLSSNTTWTTANPHSGSSLKPSITPSTNMASAIQPLLLRPKPNQLIRYPLRKRFSSASSVFIPCSPPQPRFRMVCTH